MKAVKTYLKLAWALKTPFILLLDCEYKLLELHELSLYANKLASLPYVSEYFDCDSYAWIMKALAEHDKINSIGFVIGKTHMGLHAWNCVLTPNGIRQLEPQTGRIFDYDKKYRALMIII